MTRRAVFVVPGRLEARTGGSIYNQRMVSALRARAWTIDVCELDGDFPTPSTATLSHTLRAFGKIPDGALTVVDGLVFDAIPEIAAAESDRLAFVPIVHMPLALEFGLSSESRRRREVDERRALAAARLVIVTGRGVCDAIASYGIPPHRIAVVVPGTDRAGVAPGSSGPEVQLLCVAALTPGKGHDVLLQALATVRHLSWRLTCVGSTSRCAEFVGTLQRLIATLGLVDRVIFTGEEEQAALEAAFERADVFVLATRQETFGMAVSEAIAHGLPVISTTTGEIPLLVGADAGVLVSPGDVEGFASGLAKVLTDAPFRSRLRAGALRARTRLVSWDAAARTMASVLERVTDHTTDGRSRWSDAG